MLHDHSGLGDRNACANTIPQWSATRFPQICFTISIVSTINIRFLFRLQIHVSVGITDISVNINNCFHINKYKYP